MIDIRNDAPVIEEAFFWEYIFQCGDFDVRDYTSSQISVDVLEDALRTLRAFRADLERENLINEL